MCLKDLDDKGLSMRMLLLGNHINFDSLSCSNNDA